jgi:hypothetical protein
MQRKLLPASVIALGTALATANVGHAQTTTFAVSGNTSAIANSANAAGFNSGQIQTTTPGQFFTGYSPVNLVQSPVNFTSPMQSPVNLQNAMKPIGQPTGVTNIQSAFRNLTFPLFRSHAPSVPIIPPGPGNPLQPTGLPAFHAVSSPRTTTVVGH